LKGFASVFRSRTLAIARSPARGRRRFPRRVMLAGVVAPVRLGAVEGKRGHVDLVAVVEVGGDAPASAARIVSGLTSG